MKIELTVDPDLCIGAASCVTADPQSFIMNEDNKAEVLDHGQAEGGPQYSRIMEVSEAELENVITAAQSCPTMAVIVKNLDTGEQLYP
jgi:ferredoxin